MGRGCHRNAATPVYLHCQTAVQVPPTFAHNATANKQHAALNTIK